MTNNKDIYNFRHNNLYQDILLFLKNWKPKGDIKFDIADMRQRLKRILTKHNGACGGGCEYADKCSDIERGIDKLKKQILKEKGKLSGDCPTKPKSKKRRSP